MRSLLESQNGSAFTGVDGTLADGEVVMSMPESCSASCIRIQNSNTSETRNTSGENLKADFRTACVRRVAAFPRYTVARTPVGVLYCSATTYHMIPVEEEIFSGVSVAEKTEVVTRFNFVPSWWLTKIGISRVIELVSTDSSTRGWQYQLRTFNVSAWVTCHCYCNVRKHSVWALTRYSTFQTHL